MHNTCSQQRVIYLAARGSVKEMAPEAPFGSPWMAEQPGEIYLL